MGDEVQHRVATNESTFREVNESIERGRWPGEEDAVSAFRCECARLGCSELLQLTVREYEHVRSNPRWFLIAFGHHEPSAEVIVERFEDYLVVEKVGEAGRVAEDNDPRS